MLNSFDSDLLSRTECFFGGGTAIVLALGEYRESVDIDFLCSSHDGYRLLRNTVSNDLGELLKTPLKHLREVRSDRDSIRTVLEVDGKPIKVEFLKEGNATVGGDIDSVFGVPTLSRVDMFTQKLLANADRGLDKSCSSRDIIDLAMMLHHWEEDFPAGVEKAKLAYGDCVIQGFHKAIKLIQDKRYLGGCLDRMKMEPSSMDVIHSAFCIDSGVNVFVANEYGSDKESALVFDMFAAGKSLEQAKKLAAQKGSFVVVDSAANAEHSGVVLGVTDRHVVVSMGRSALILAKNDLDRVPETGQSVKVKYSGGRGVVDVVKTRAGIGCGR